MSSENEVAGGSALAPLKIRVFRAIWLAVLVSNVGMWMQTVGAQWLLVHGAGAAILVSLVQTVDMLPDLMFGLVGGVLADIFDRKKLLIATQLFMAIAAGTMTALTAADKMPPALLLTFTFILGTSSVLAGPAYQALIPELVPRSQIAAAASLGSVSINLARSVGPAIAGIMIARSSVAAVFAVDAAGFLLYALVVVAWRRGPQELSSEPERFASAFQAGARYVRNAPVIRRMLLRIAMFLIPASVLWALLPLIATRRLNLGSGGYGLLLAALGIGAVAGAFVLPPVRARLSSNGLLASASALYAAALIVIALSRQTPVVVVALLAAGLAWMAVLSSMNASLQLFLPEWVRARGISIYLMVMFGSQAAGSAIWGGVAAATGLVPAFLIATVTLLAGLATIKSLPLVDTRGMGRETEIFWPEPQLASGLATGDGPVVVKSTYTVASAQQAAFVSAMSRVRLSRLRTGAIQWGLFRDAEAADSFVELFVVPSWEEHQRQHRERQTSVDRALEQEADAFSDPPPETTHLVSADQGEDANS